MSDLPVVRVQIFGSEYKIATKTDPEHAREVARYVDRKMREIAHSLSLRSVSKIAVLTVVNLADELFKEEEAGRQIAQTVGEKTDRLADSVNRVAWGG